MNIINIIHIAMKRRLKHLINISLAVFIIHIVTFRVIHRQYQIIN